MDFNQIVKEIALPELTPFGFKIYSEYKGSVRFNSHRISISFGYDYARSKDSSVNISLLGFGETLYTFNTLTYYKYVVERKKEKPQLNIEEDGHAGWIKWNLELLKSDGALLLKGNEPYFFEVYEFLKDKSHDYTENIRLETLRSKIDQAWQKRDYPQIVELIKDDYDNLSPAYQKKYAYALKKVL